MSKDPAILFYTSDFLTGTITMNNEQVGKYIRLLCLQHQKGFLTEKDMLNICQSYDEDIFQKFEKNGEGKYINIRLNEEILKRKAYSESRSINRKGNKHKHSRKKKHMSNISESYVEHMENENEDENRSINEDKKESKGEKKEEINFPWDDERFIQVWNFWKEYKKQQHRFTYKQIGEQGALNDLYEISKGKIETAMLIIKQSIQKGWKGFFELQGQFKGMDDDYNVENIMNLINK